MPSTPIDYLDRLPREYHAGRVTREYLDDGTWDAVAIWHTSTTTYVARATGYPTRHQAETVRIELTRTLLLEMLHDQRTHE